MRTTVNLDDDVAAAVEHIRRERGVGLSEAVNELVRAGLSAKPKPKRFVQKTYDGGRLLIDITSIGRALDEAEGPHHR